MQRPLLLLVQEPKHPKWDVVERGVLDVVPHNVGFRGVYRSNLAAGFVFPTFFIILFFDAKIRIIIKTAHSVVHFFAVFAR